MKLVFPSVIFVAMTAKSSVLAKDGNFRGGSIRKKKQGGAAHPPTARKSDHKMNVINKERSRALFAQKVATRSGHNVETMNHVPQKTTDGIHHHVPASHHKAAHQASKHTTPMNGNTVLTIGDVPGWYDSDGPEWDCARYGEEYYYEGSYYNTCSVFGYENENFGLTAIQACTVCGGGLRQYENGECYAGLGTWEVRVDCDNPLATNLHVMSSENMAKTSTAAVGDGEICFFSEDCESGRCELVEVFPPIRRCLPKLENGEKCSEDSDCLSNYCIDEWIDDDDRCGDENCSGVPAGIFDYVPEFSDSTNRLWSHMDDATQTLALLLPQSLVDSDVLTHEDLNTEDVDLGWEKSEGSGFSGPWTPSPAEASNENVGPSWSIDILKEDDFIEETPLNSIKDIFLDVIRDEHLFPMVDKPFYFDSTEETEEFLKDLKLHPGSEGGAFPDSYNSDFEMISDDSFSRMFFFGMGIPIIAAQEDDMSDNELGPFVADMPLQDYAHREHFRRLGTRVHFDTNQQVTAIFDYVKEELYRPGDDGWEEAKYHAKATTITLVTVREHLIWTHIIMANSVSHYSTVNLPPNHPLRRLLTIHTYRSNTVNSAAFNALVPERSMLHRASGFTHEAMKNVFDFAFSTSNIFEPFPNHAVNPALQSLVDDGKFPFISEGLRYYNIVESFVTKWLQEAGDSARDEYAENFYEAMKESTMRQKYEIPEYSGDSSMIDLITQIIFTVTAYHELVGYVRDFNLPTTGGFSRISDECDPLQADVQAFTLQTMVAASTSLRMPFLMRDYPNFFGAGGAPDWERTVWDEFVGELEILSNDIQLADEERLNNNIPEFKHMDPARFECSVSV